MFGEEPVEWFAVTTTEDEFGNVTPTVADPVTVRALVAARSVSESASPRTPAVLTGKTLYLLDPSVEPGPSDFFTIRGDRYEVEGESHRWGPLGVEVAVARAGVRP